MQRATLSALTAIAMGAGFVLLRGEGLDLVSVGALGGVCLGAAAGLLSHTLVAAAMQLRSEKALQFVLAGFGIKAFGAIAPWAILSFLGTRGRRRRRRRLPGGYISAALLVLGAGVFDHLRLAAVVSHQRRAPSGRRSHPSGLHWLQHPLESAS